MQVNERYFNDNTNQMHEIEDVLTEGEKVLWRGKPNKTSYIWAAVLKMMPIALLWLAFDGAFIYMMLTADEAPTEMMWFIIPFFAIHLAPVWIWIGNIVKAVGEIRNIEYAITDKRVIIRSGMVGIDFKFINHTEIDSVNVKTALVTTATLIAPMLAANNANPIIVGLAICLGGLGICLPTDGAFWQVKAFNNLSMKDTFVAHTGGNLIACIVGFIVLCILSFMPFLPGLG